MSTRRVFYALMNSSVALALSLTVQAQPAAGGSGAQKHNNPGYNTDSSGMLAGFLTGKVMTDDGSPVPNNVAIARVCETSIHKMGYADARGFFSVYIDNDAGVMQDASDTSGGAANPFLSKDGTDRSDIGSWGRERLFQNCDLQAVLPGYSSTVIILSGLSSAGDPEIGTILIHRQGPAEANSVSFTSLSAPKAARKQFEKGLDLLKKQDIAGARACFQTAVTYYPYYAAAWTEMGKLSIAAHDNAAARNFFEKAAQADSKFVGAYLGLSILAYNAHDWKTLVAATFQTVTLDPLRYPQAFLMNAFANLRLFRLDDAEKSIRRAQLLDRAHRFVEIPHVYALILAARHEYAQAAGQLRMYLTLSPHASDASTASTELAEYENASSAASNEK